jgi:pyrroloquinoline quinone (PQQ) biosynthesis protein C
VSAFEQLEQHWHGVERAFMASRPMQRLQRGEVGLDHYAAYLRETYFYTREDPQKQATATARFRGADREMVKYFLRHALSEVGHDQMALNDLATIGFDTSPIPAEEPLPATIAMTGFAYYAIHYRQPISYLGWLYFLEFLPTSSGGGIAAALTRIGVPETAMTFLDEHRTVDTQHNKLMRIYADHMIRTHGDLAEVAYAMTVTGALFANMLEGAFEAADCGALPARLATPGPATASRAA